MVINGLKVFLRYILEANTRLIIGDNKSGVSKEEAVDDEYV